MTKILELADNDAIDTIVNGALRTVSDLSNFKGSVGVFGKAMAVAGTAFSAITLGKSLVNAYKEHKESKAYSLSIVETSPLFDAAQDWIREIADENDIKQISGSFSGYVNRDEFKKGKSFIKTSFADSISVDTVVHGHKVTIETSRLTPPSSNTGAESASDSGQKGVYIPKSRRAFGTPSINITTHSPAGHQAVLDELNVRVSRIMYSEEPLPKLYISSTWGEFTSKQAISRPSESVILEEGVWDSINSHVRSFLENEDKYRKLAMPYHTGILLYGPPGTGKTSVVSALSTEFGMDIYHINLRPLESDNDLVDLFSSIPKRSIILLEDIDVATPSATSREDADQEEDTRITLSGLLNVLDGNLSPYGSITVMTTNNKESLDKAITRPGRTDISHKLDYLTNEQLLRICTFYLGYIPKNMPKITKEDKLTSAEVTGIFRNHINDLSKSEPDLIELLHELSRRRRKLHAVA